jgi:hypothetical protein
LEIFRRTLIALFAFELSSEPGCSAVFAQDPVPGYQRRLVADMLIVSALKLRPPVAVVVFVITNDLLFHFSGGPVSTLLRIDPELVRLFDTGFHHRKIESAISQQTPDAKTSGSNLSKCRASAASTVADNIQSCAMLIITSSTRRACHTAVRPRTGVRRRPGVTAA